MKSMCLCSLPLDVGKSGVKHKQILPAAISWNDRVDIDLKQYRSGNKWSRNGTITSWQSGTKSYAQCFLWVYSLCFNPWSNHELALRFNEATTKTKNASRKSIQSCEEEYIELLYSVGVLKLPNILKLRMTAICIINLVFTTLTEWNKFKSITKEEKIHVSLWTGENQMSTSV